MVIVSSISSQFTDIYEYRMLSDESKHMKLSSKTRSPRDPFFYLMISSHKSFHWSWNLLREDKIVCRFLQEQASKKEVSSSP